MVDPTHALLARAPGLTLAPLLRALEVAREPAGLPRLPTGSLLAAGWPAAAAAWLRNPDRGRLEADLRIYADLGVCLVPAYDPAYPPLLAQIRDAPAVLQVRGRVELLGHPQVAIVGSRYPTPPGARTARDFARCLAGAGLAITSGLAVGIDAAAHEGALSAGPASDARSATPRSVGGTLAVCGTGLDSTYPPENAALAARIASEGALISEFCPGTPPIPRNFPRRNRLISGLSLGVLVVEAARRSGSLSTANHALAQGREVFAIPGSIHNPLARGCHDLLRSGARLVEQATDVLEELDFSSLEQPLAITAPRAGSTPAGLGPLDKEYEILLDALGFEPTSVDSLASRTGMASESVASMLLILELEGRIEPHPGGRYGRVPQES